MQTPQFVTADQAIARAFWMVKLPSMAVLIVPCLAGWLGVRLHYLPSYGLPGLQWAGPVLLLAIGGGWLIWSIQIPKWRLWAYEHVQDIRELKRKAAQSQLIWPEGHFFERTEIASRETWRRVRSLETAVVGRAANNHWRGP
jgi:hypothetical protein